MTISHIVNAQCGINRSTEWRLDWLSYLDKTAVKLNA